ncbi:MAG: hypothetical protein V3V11_07115, partial [Vicinamibacteria bacterium]
MTTASTLLVGAYQGLAFASAEAQELFPSVMPAAKQLQTVLTYGAPFSFTIMAILLSHEMGHYLTARYYQVKASL